MCPIVRLYDTLDFLVQLSCSVEFVRAVLLRCASLFPYLTQGKDKTAEERRIAICIFDDVAEQCRETALK